MSQEVKVYNENIFYFHAEDATINTHRDGFLPEAFVVKEYHDRIVAAKDAQNKRLNLRIKELESALEFYADKTNYGSSFYELGGMHSPYGDISISDLENIEDYKMIGGKRARAALKGGENV